MNKSIIFLAIIVAVALAQPYYISVSPCTKNHSTSALPDENYFLYPSGVCFSTVKYIALANGTLITEIYGAAGCSGTPSFTTASNPTGECQFGSASYVYNGQFTPNDGHLIVYSYGDGNCGNFTLAQVKINGSSCGSYVDYQCTTSTFTYEYCSSGTLNCGSCTGTAINHDNGCNNFAPPPPQTPIPVPPFNPVAPVTPTSSIQYFCQGFVPAPTAPPPTTAPPTPAPTTAPPTTAPPTAAPTGGASPTTARPSGNPTTSIPTAPRAPLSPSAPVPTAPNSGSIVTFSALLSTVFIIFTLF